ncbi:hypothetical protein EYC80_003388 [Monilinia laxa]|uniref:Uncharacterized protein n=1 Tax=Monilinia laxa TaxID=61186 RepID=A0A5N6KEX8_MONLA|nr:hypothetical protein EYC80_003388 [Monilinia laxa]
MNSELITKWLENLDLGSESPSKHAHQTEYLPSLGPSPPFNAKNSIEAICQIIRDHLDRLSNDLPEGTSTTEEYTRAQDIYVKLIDDLRGAVKHDLLLTVPAPTKLYAVLGLDERATTSFGEIEKYEALIMQKARKSDEKTGKKWKGKEVVRPSDIDREKNDEDMKHFWGREKAELQEILRGLGVLKKRNETASEGINELRRELRREMEGFQQELREARLNVPPPPAPLSISGDSGYAIR